MKAILIDPKHRAIMQIDYNGDYKTIYEHLSFINSFGYDHVVRNFDVVRTPTEGDGIYVLTHAVLNVGLTDIPLLE